MGTKAIKITMENRVACQVTMDRQLRFITLYPAFGPIEMTPHGESRNLEFRFTGKRRALMECQRIFADCGDEDVTIEVGRFLARRCKIEKIVLAGTNELVVIAAWHTDLNGQFN